MSARTRILAASLGLAGVVLPLTAAGAAHADEGDSDGDTAQGYGYDTVNETSEYPSTQNPLQLLPAGLATVGNTGGVLVDALNGADRPEGANGTQAELPGLDPTLVEGPVGGLLVNGPLE